MKKLLLLLILSLSVAVSGFAFDDKTEVVIYPQPDSPLQLSNLVSSWRLSKAPDNREVNMLTASLVIRNVSQKAIRAYTIRYFEGDFKTDVGGTGFTFSVEGKELLKPEQSYNDSIGEMGSTPQSKIIKFAVDFVEFTDGTIWGPDLSESTERLAGVREGIRQSQEYLQKIYRQNGAGAVLKALGDLTYIMPPENQHDKWKTEFKRGTQHFKFHLERLYEKEGIKALEAELQKQTI